jgi:hypothetical protein
MNKRYDRLAPVNRAGVVTGSMLAFVFATAAGASATARAEYRCGASALQEDRRACELAQRDSPDALRQFIDRTRGIYALYFYDYVTDADADRWEAARNDEKAPSTAVAQSRD